MKNIMLSALLIVAAVNGFTQARANTIFSKDEVTLSEINHQFIQNFITNDTIAHNKIIHLTNFLFIGGDGKFADRKTYMGDWAHGYNKETLHDFVIEDEQVRIFGNMAIIIAKTHYKTIKEDQWIVGETRYSDTYIKENGKWLCVQVQLTKLAVPEH